MHTQPTTQSTTTRNLCPEAVPQMWCDERDEPFFRLTADAFTADFTMGATVLLASYDAE